MTGETGRGGAHEGRVILLLAALAVAVRFAASSVAGTRMESDAVAYWTMAENLAEGRGLVDNFGNLAYFNSGYPIVLAGLFRVFGRSLGLVLAFHALLGGASVYLVYRVGLSVFASSQTALLAAALSAVDVPSIQCATFPAKENLMTPLMLALAWIAAAYGRSPRAGAGVPTAGALSLAGGLVAGSLVLVGMTGSAVSGGLVAAILARGGRWRRRLAHGTAFAAAGALIVLPWAWRNDRRLGSPVLATSAGFNLYLGNNSASGAVFSGIEATPLGADWNRRRAELGELEADRELRRAALAYMRDEPARTLRRWLERSALLWKPPAARVAGEDKALERAMRITWMVQYAAVAALASAAALVDWRRAWPLAAGLACYTAVHAPFFVFGRYRTPVMPWLALLAARAVVLAWQRARRRESGEAPGP